jgi:hypothetical protein
MKKNKVIKLSLAIIISLLFVKCTGNSKKTLHKELIKTAAEWNRATPVAFNQHIRLDSLGVTKDNVFQYYYTLTNIDNPNELIDLHKEEMLEEVDNLYTKDRSLQFFVKNNVTIEYIYRDIDQNVIDIITIETEKYKKRIQQ